MLSPDQRNQTPQEDRRTSPVLVHPLKGDLFECSVYRGAELQKANRQLAHLTGAASRYYKAIVDMPTTHVVFLLPKILSETVAPILTLGGLIAIATGHPVTALFLIAANLAFRMMNTDPLPLEEYANSLAKIQTARTGFLESFKDPLQACPTSPNVPVAHHALLYFAHSVEALASKASIDAAFQPDFVLKLKQATQLLDLEVDPFDYHATGVLKSERAAADVKTLELLSRLFDIAGDFSLNGFESERARFEESFGRLKAHLDTTALHSVAAATSLHDSATQPTS